MTTNEALNLVLAVAAGGLLGAVFFGGLWWTVRRGLSSGRPALWFIGSFLVRLATVLAGLYFVSGGQWQRLLACLAGFIGARIIITRLTASQQDPGVSPATGAGHAA